MKIRELIARLKFKYNVVVINEKTLTEKFNIHLSWLSLMAMMGILVLICFALLSLLIFATPVKHFLPGYGTAETNERVINEALRVDSLAHEIEVYEQQFDNIKMVISGEISLDSIPGTAQPDSSRANLPVEATDRERSFVQEHKKDNK